jgi:hypothetical protein
MVKRQYYLLMFLFLLVSCKKNYIFTYDNSNVVYENFTDTIIDISNLKLNSIEAIDTKIFDLGKINNKDCKKKLSSNANNILALLQENVYANFYAIKDHEAKQEIISIDKNIDLFPLGEIDLCKGVHSYIILKISRQNKVINKELIAYNVKSDKVRSVVFLAYLSPSREGMISKKALITKNRIVEQISQPCLYFISEEVTNYLNLNNIMNKNGHESYSFSGFEVNEEGFVELIN